ncbi:unnamed protein product [Symbiodinium sp. KB8]|nr:unnamed protein product [Symbiodinium sp. KB8]
MLEELSSRISVAPDLSSKLESSSVEEDKFKLPISPRSRKAEAISDPSADIEMPLG